MSNYPISLSLLPPDLTCGLPIVKPNMLGPTYPEAELAPITPQMGEIQHPKNTPPGRYLRTVPRKKSYVTSPTATHFCRNNFNAERQNWNFHVQSLKHGSCFSPHSMCKRVKEKNNIFVFSKATFDCIRASTASIPHFKEFFTFFYNILYFCHNAIF